MSSSGSPSSRAIDRVQPQRDRLRDAHHQFSAACEAPDASESLPAALAVLRAAFDAHVEYAEGEGGLFEEMLDEAPTEAAQEVDRLKRDHEVIAATMERLGDSLDKGGGSDDQRLAETAGELSRLVAQHRRHGAELLYNVYAVDTGAGD